MPEKADKFKVTARNLTIFLNLITIKSPNSSRKQGILPPFFTFMTLWLLKMLQFATFNKFKTGGSLNVMFLKKVVVHSH